MPENEYSDEQKKADVEALLRMRSRRVFDFMEFVHAADSDGRRRPLNLRQRYGFWLRFHGGGKNPFHYMEDDEDNLVFTPRPFSGHQSRRHVSRPWSEPNAVQTAG